MCRIVEREDFVLNKKKAEECLLMTYDLFKLKKPKNIVWRNDIFDKDFNNAASSAWYARSAISASSAWYASSARSARSAWSAWSAWSARSAWYASSASSARSAWSFRNWIALDYDFDWYVFEFQYCKDPTNDKPNENDRVYLQYSELLMKAKEYGCGYRVEWNNTLYLVPTPIVRLDRENRYHSLTGPAIFWKDGAKFYYSHGVNIREDIILHPEKLTKKDWMDETNTEVRRVIQELMGERFVKEVGGKVISKSKRGELLEIELPNDPEKIAHYVKVKDASTPRVYYLRTPPDIQDVDESIAWTFSMDVKDYQLSQET